MTGLWVAGCLPAITCEDTLTCAEASHANEGDDAGDADANSGNVEADADAAPRTSTAMSASAAPEGGSDSTSPDAHRADARASDSTTTGDSVDAAVPHCDSSVGVGSDAMGCTASSECAPGEHTSLLSMVGGHALCEPCEEGTFSLVANATECTPLHTCGWAPVATPGTRLSDTVCETKDVVKQFGSDAYEVVAALAANTEGALYVAGRGQDAFVRKYDTVGDLEWSETFGSEGITSVHGVAVGLDGDLVVVGEIEGMRSDAYVRKYSSTGNILWTDQFGSDEEDIVSGVAVSSQGLVAAVGYTLGDLFHVGTSSDAFVRTYSPDGTPQWSTQFGSTDEDETATAVAFDDNQNIFVVGKTGGVLGEMPAGGGDAFVRKYSLAGDVLWTLQFGSSDMDTATAVTVSSEGQVFVAGRTWGGIDLESLGGEDAFLCALTTDGKVDWLRQFGTTNGDYAAAVAVSPTGLVYVAGTANFSVTDPFDPTTATGEAILAEFDSEGTAMTSRLLGTPQLDEATALTITRPGYIFVGGQTNGDWATSNVGASDAFVVQMRPND